MMSSSERATISNKSISNKQLYAVSKLIGICECAVMTGDLNEDQEGRLRVAIVDACRAFELPTISEMEKTEMAPSNDNKFVAARMAEQAPAQWWVQP